jgi:phenylpropionate dioxygenase-like ring-hydroxylating dioxygenase large terminal subunit
MNAMDGTPARSQAATEYFVEDAAQGRFRLNPTAYTDPAVFAAEQRAVFDRCWLYLGHQSEVPNPGDFVTRRVGGRPLLLARGSDGTVRTFLNVCSHRGSTVCRERRGNAKAWTCFYHSWSYDTCGALLGLPNPEAYGPGFDTRELGLVEVRMENYRGLLFVCYSPDAEGLVEYLAGARDALDLILDRTQGDGLAVLHGTHEYGIRANWKALMENTMDGYHLFQMHRRFMTDYMQKVLNVNASRQVFDSGGVYDLGNGHAMFEHAALGGAANVDAEKRALFESRYGKERAERMLGKIRQLSLFPNTLFIELWQSIRTINPISQDAMEVSAWALMERQDDPELRERRLAMYTAFLGPCGFATPDDIEALELCHQNYRNVPEMRHLDMSRGMTKPHQIADDELQLRVFWKRWRELLRAEGERRR